MIDRKEHRLNKNNTSITHNPDIWVNSSVPPSQRGDPLMGWITEKGFAGNNEWFGALEELDLTLWRKFERWNGKEAPRDLFDTVFGHLDEANGLLGSLLFYRGINLAHLLEGTCITLEWPRWFEELAAWHDLVERHPNAHVILDSPDSIRNIVVTQCLKDRHPNINIINNSKVSSINYFQKVFYRLQSNLKKSDLIYRVLHFTNSMAKALGKLLINKDGSEEKAIAFFPLGKKKIPNIVPLFEEWSQRFPETAVIAGWDQENT